MPVIGYPIHPDPEIALKEFQRLQAEFEATWWRTKDLHVLCKALEHVKAARQLAPDWLLEAAGGVLKMSRTARAVKRFEDCKRHARRYQIVRDLRRKGHIKDDALDQAVEVLAAEGDVALRPTIKDSYVRVYRDLKKKGQKSEFHAFVAPTVVPFKGRG
jgi:hypothetical protein